MTFVVVKELVATAASKSDSIMAVWSSVGGSSMSPWSPCNLLLIILQVRSFVGTASIDAFLLVESMVVDGMMPGLNWVVLGFGIIYVRSSGDIKVRDSQ